MVYQTPRSINNAAIALSGSIPLPSAMTCRFCVNPAPSVTKLAPHTPLFRQSIL